MCYKIGKYDQISDCQSFVLFHPFVVGFVVENRIVLYQAFLIVTIADGRIFQSSSVNSTAKTNTFEYLALNIIDFVFKPLYLPIVFLADAGNLLVVQFLFVFFLSDFASSFIL